jgi:predicted nuclease of predicted toxin-antitoxin system
LRVLLDENVPKRLLRYLPRDVEATTVPLRGWAGKKNGELLSMASREFDVFLTTNQGIPHEQDLSRFDLAVLILRARSNSFEDLKPLIEEISDLLAGELSGEAVFVEA